MSVSGGTHPPSPSRCAHRGSALSGTATSPSTPPCGSFSSLRVRGASSLYTRSPRFYRRWGATSPPTARTCASPSLSMMRRCTSRQVWLHTSHARSSTASTSPSSTVRPPPLYSWSLSLTVHQRPRWRFSTTRSATTTIPCIFTHTWTGLSRQRLHRCWRRRCCGRRPHWPQGCWTSTDGVVVTTPTMPCRRGSAGTAASCTRRKMRWCSRRVPSSAPKTAA